MIVGAPERRERVGDSLEPDGAGDQWSHIYFALRDRAQRRRELIRVIGVHEVEVELLDHRDEGTERVGLHAHAGDDNAASRRCVEDRLIEHPRHPDCLEEHQRAQPVDAPPRVDHRLRAWVDDLVRPHCRRKCTPLLGEVTGDDSLDAARGQPGDDRQPDGSAPDHDCGVAVTQTGAGNRVQAHRHRFGQRGTSVIEAIGHGQAQRATEEHPLREAAGKVVGEPKWDQGFAPQEVRDRHDQIARLDGCAVASGPELEHLGAPLVTEHVVGLRIEREVGPHRGPHLREVLGVVERVEIGAADPARPHRDQHVVRARDRVVDLFDEELASSGHHRLHDGEPTSRGLLSGSVEDARSDDIQRLLDLAELQGLKARYWRCLDTKSWDELRGVFATDAHLDTDGFVNDGSGTIIDFLAEVLADARTVHMGHAPELEVTGPDTATGIWPLEDYVELPADSGRGMRGYGHYYDEYVREDGAWRIKSSRLVRLRVDPLS